MVLPFLYLPYSLTASLPQSVLPSPSVLNSSPRRMSPSLAHLANILLMSEQALVSNDGMSSSPRFAQPSNIESMRDTLPVLNPLRSALTIFLQPLNRPARDAPSGKLTSRVATAEVMVSSKPLHGAPALPILAASPLSIRRFPFSSIPQRHSPHLPTLIKFPAIFSVPFLLFIYS